MKIAFIEPPAKFMIMRDMYSSTISKLGYSWPNVDLLSLSASLREQFECKIFDFNARNTRIEDAVEIIKDFAPDHAIFAYGESNARGDLEFAKLIKNEILPEHGKILGTGGTLIHEPKKFMDAETWMDGIILNYAYNGLYDFLRKGHISFNIFGRDPKTNEVSFGERVQPKMGFDLAAGKHEDLATDSYFLPQMRGKKFTSIATSWGCPYKCSFCVSSTLNYSFRSAESIFEEIKYCISLGITGFFFRDNVFAINKKMASKLAKLLESVPERITFISDARIDYISCEIAEIVAKIGDGALNFGIETVNEETLKNYQKGLKNNNAVSALEICKASKIITTGYFILGLPGEKQSDVENTITYACSLPLDYASFNLPIPIEGTELRKKAIKDKLISDDFKGYDGSGQALLPNDEISNETLLRLHKKAFKKFYFRPKIIARITIQNLSMRNIKKLSLAAASLFLKSPKVE